MLDHAPVQGNLAGVTYVLPAPDPAPPQSVLDHLLREGLILAPVTCQRLPGGRSNRVWRIGNQVLKLYSPDTGSILFPNDPAAEALALRSLQGTGLAPDFVAHGQTADGHWLLYHHLEGQVWTCDPAPVALALARLHQVPAPTGVRSHSGGGEDLVAQGLSLLVPVMGHPMAERLRRERPEAAIGPVGKPVFLHGDPVPGNIVMTRQGLKLIDWQCPARGDASVDLAVFLSPAMQMLYRGQILDENEVNTFLSAYPDPSVLQRYQTLRPLYHWRMACYCLNRFLSGAADYGPALELEITAMASDICQM